MEDRSPPHAPSPERPLPAWTFSVLAHVGLLLLVVYAIERMPRGAADEPGRTAGIVLKRTSAEGNLYDGEADLAATNDSSADLISPDEVLAVLPSDTSAAESGADLPEMPTVGPGPTARGGQPNASEFTQGGGGRPGSTAGGGEAQVSIFGVAGTGNKFVYVFDRSSSMEGAPLAAAKRQLIDSINSLDSVHQFQIVFFNHDLRMFDITGGQRRIAFATDRNKQLAANFIGGITADGGTDRFAALKKAIELRPDVIFFLTDGDDGLLPSELAQLYRLNGAGATICTIEFGQGAVRHRGNFLTELAEHTRGQYGYIDTTRLAP